MRIALLACLLAACGGHGSSNGAACHELSLADCRVTAGCKPDICSGCICDLQVRGCLAESETPTKCPDIGCPSGQCCTAQQQCPLDTACAPPGTPLGCGSCSNDPGDCATDAECKPRGATLVCDPVPCGCNAQKTCQPGCTNDTMCRDGTRCDVASARCIAIACSGDAQCPANFHCAGSTCARDACTDDRDCDGFCVLGECFASGRGECRGPSA